MTETVMNINCDGTPAEATADAIAKLDEVIAECLVADERTFRHAGMPEHEVARMMRESRDYFQAFRDRQLVCIRNEIAEF